MEVNRQITLKNGEQIEIRTTKETDTKNLVRYYNQLYLETENFTRGSLDTVSEKDIKPTKSRDVLLVALLDNKIVGHVEISEKSSKARLKHRCELSIGVLKSHWKKGIAGKLLSEIISCAAALNYEQIDLIVLKTNKPAIKLYKSFGFKKTGTILHSFKMEDSRYIDGIFMTKILGEYGI